MTASSDMGNLTFSESYLIPFHLALYAIQQIISGSNVADMETTKHVE